MEAVDCAQIYLAAVGSGLITGRDESCQRVVKLFIVGVWFGEIEQVVDYFE